MLTPLTSYMPANIIPYISSLVHAAAFHARHRWTHRHEMFEGETWINRSRKEKLPNSLRVTSSVGVFKNTA